MLGPQQYGRRKIQLLTVSLRYEFANVFSIWRCLGMRTCNVGIDTAVLPCDTECVVSICSILHWHNHIRYICVAFHGYADIVRDAPALPT